MRGGAVAAPYVYGAWGLRIATPFVCPGLVAAEARGVPDVVVRIGGDVPDALPAATMRGATFEATADALLLRVPGVGRFLVRDGREVAIAPAAGADDDALRVFLLGSCVAALLQQRGVLALHASAVRLPVGAVLLAGESGAGKSTLAAALVRRGGTLVADDVAAVTFDAAGRPQVLPGSAQVKLWPDAADGLAHDVATLRRVRPTLAKVELPLARVGDAPVPLRAAFVLHAVAGDGVQVAALDPAARFAAIVRNSYRERFLDPAVRRPQHFQLAARLAGVLPTSDVLRPVAPLRLDALDALAARIVAATAALAAERVAG